MWVYLDKLDGGVWGLRLLIKRSLIGLQRLQAKDLEDWEQRRVKRLPGEPDGTLVWLQREENIRTSIGQGVTQEFAHSDAVSWYHSMIIISSGTSLPPLYYRSSKATFSTSHTWKGAFELHAPAIQTCVLDSIRDMTGQRDKGAFSISVVLVSLEYALDEVGIRTAHLLICSHANMNITNVNPFLSSHPS